MEKFSQMPYERLDIAAVSAEISAHIEKMENAETYPEMREAFLSLEKIFMHIQSITSIAYVRNTMDTSDKFYEDEIEFYNNESPKLSLLEKQAGLTYLASKFKTDFEAEFGTQLTRLMEGLQKTQSEAIIPELIEEAKLSTEYSKLAASCSVEFMGEQCNFYGLLKHMQVTDRSERKAAFEAWADLYESVSDKLDEIYTKLVGLRVEMAKKLGLKDYAELGYLNMQRFEYTPEDVARFRGYVKKYYVPLVKKIHKAQEKRIGVDKLKMYDEELIFPEGNATPIGTKDELVEKARKMYHELSPQTGEFFDFMVKYELFDLVTKPNKHLGGYCTMFADYAAPFIFSNFNGTAADVDVLTHEAGHAFQCYLSSRKQSIAEYISSTSEINEIHSMSMEQFTYPYMENFFGDATERYLKRHLADAIGTIPYLVSVDEFQHVMYEKPELTAKQRRSVWKEIEEKYMPWRDYDGNPFLSEGGYWMQKQHIFLYPYYYVDYALAQTCAFQLYIRSLSDFPAAWNDYMNLCAAGGSKGYFELLKTANLESPFEEETVKFVAESIEKKLTDMGMI